MKTVPKLILKVSGVCIIAMLAACCESADIKPEAAVNDFFPLQENTERAYLHQFFSTDEDSTLYESFTYTLFTTVNGDTTLEGRAYKKIVDESGAIIKLVRKEGTRYFGRNHELYSGFSHEFMFLDTSVPLHGSWSYLKNDGNFKTEYVVKAVGTSRTFNGVAYDNVMELEAAYYILIGEMWELNYVTRHFYAGGIGEIYAYYPYPASMTYSNLNVTLINVP